MIGRASWFVSFSGLTRQVCVRRIKALIEKLIYVGARVMFVSAGLLFSLQDYELHWENNARF